MSMLLQVMQWIKIVAGEDRSFEDVKNTNEITKHRKIIRSPNMNLAI